jgi:hypothetical protein
VYGNEGSQPQKDAFLLVQVLSLELNNDLLEERTDQFVVFQAHQGVLDRLIIAVAQNPV